LKKIELILPQKTEGGVCHFLKVFKPKKCYGLRRRFSCYISSTCIKEYGVIVGGGVLKNFYF